jgi:hypothetical protein
MLAAMDKAQLAQSAQSIAQSLLLDPLNEGMNLARRYQEGRGLRDYVLERSTLLVPIAVLMALTSLACAAATVMYLGGLRPFLVLLSLLLAPVVLAGSAFVQAYVFVSWLENRAIAKALRRAPRPANPITARLLKSGIDLGKMPPVPWVLAIVFFALPLAMVVSIAPAVGAALIALHVLTPFAYARLDR